MLISGTLWFLIAFFAYKAYVYGQGLYYPVIAFLATLMGCGFYLFAFLQHKNTTKKHP
ncbi:hypothetical protein ACFC8U_01050 [Enterococcus casseliflavus]|uniref:hypothetical protein n=1 Tax=Enterococcus casseliflavus TaxID=37734 RepID=UPI0039A4DA38